MYVYEQTSVWLPLPVVVELYGLEIVAKSMETGSEMRRKKQKTLVNQLAFANTFISSTDV